jgi:regulator of replication initiation timing
MRKIKKLSEEIDKVSVNEITEKEIDEITEEDIDLDQITEKEIKQITEEEIDEPDEKEIAEKDNRSAMFSMNGYMLQYSYMIYLMLTIYNKKGMIMQQEKHEDIMFKDGNMMDLYQLKYVNTPEHLNADSGLLKVILSNYNKENIRTIFFDVISANPKILNLQIIFLNELLNNDKYELSILYILDRLYGKEITTNVKTYTYEKTIKSLIADKAKILKNLDDFVDDINSDKCKIENINKNIISLIHKKNKCNINKNNLNKLNKKLNKKIAYNKKNINGYDKQIKAKNDNIKSLKKKLFSGNPICNFYNYYLKNKDSMISYIKKLRIRVNKISYDDIEKVILEKIENMNEFKHFIKIGDLYNMSDNHKTFKTNCIYGLIKNFCIRNGFNNNNEINCDDMITKLNDNIINHNTSLDIIKIIFNSARLIKYDDKIDISCILSHYILNNYSNLPSTISFLYHATKNDDNFKVVYDTFAEISKVIHCDFNYDAKTHKFLYNLMSNKLKMDSKHKFSTLVLLDTKLKAYYKQKNINEINKINTIKNTFDKISNNPTDETKKQSYKKISTK